MSDTVENKTNTTTEEKKTSTLSAGKTLSIKIPASSDRSSSQKTVSVQVKRRRAVINSSSSNKSQNILPKHTLGTNKNLSGGEFDARIKAVQEAQKNLQADAEQRKKQEENLHKLRQEQQSILKNDVVKKVDVVEEKQAESQDIDVDDTLVNPEIAAAALPVPEEHQKNTVKSRKDHTLRPVEDNKRGTVTYRVAAPIKKVAEQTERKTQVVQQNGPKKFSAQQLNRVLDDNYEEKGRSLASVRRHREKIHKQAFNVEDGSKVIREVIIPETILVGELSSRMAVRSGDVIKELMKLGMMVTINQAIDADTAELICNEFGHTPKRVSEDDMEIDILGAQDVAEDLVSRAPVVTIMGHVDHGKTSLLDALRQTDVVSGESGGITQHIGAYQITLTNNQKITFIDTPGHAAFSEMRSRGANTTDIVVLVVAADDGIKEQTIEAINHAKAAGVPIIVAINKIDKPEANSQKVRNALMNHDILLEDFGGEIMGIDVSAKGKLNLDKLEEAILLQAEILELKANPNRTAHGAIIEARVDKGRGIVATVLVQNGTLKIGDIFVAGSEWGKVRALHDDKGRKINVGLPSMPVEVLGFNGVPDAGDELIVVTEESQAREITERRLAKKRTAESVVCKKTNMEKLMGAIAAGEAKELNVVIKTDVHGSLEAIHASLQKLTTEEVSVRLLHGGVGAINESDITLARASDGIVLGFNVRANPQARDVARRDNVDIRYYSIIYNLIDDMKAVMGGLLAPTLREKYLGKAEIREVFKVPRAGKAAGCMVTEGVVKRGAGVRLLRDDVVVHEGTLKSLRRFKDEVKEVKGGFECGMAFENYQDIKQGDMIECFEMESIAREL
ncbi:MAG TPA: translation initiation factor IF-2 [Holosporales bacterium]|nr:translation initiation factor IF-2 [Holosporales bacterium]